MAVIRKPIVLPTIALIKLWEWAGYESHIVIGTNELWQTKEAERELEEAIHADLEGRGLGDGVRPSEELRGTLEVIAKAEAEVYGWVSNTALNANGGVIVAEYKGHGVRLIRGDEATRIEPIPVGEVAEYAVQALPPDVPPEPFNQFTVEVPSDGSETGRFEMTMKKATSGPSEKAQLKRFEKGPHTGVHELYVVARANGERRESESFSVLDLRNGGRVLVTHVKERGEPRLSCMPGSDQNTVYAIQESWQALMRQLTPART